MPFKITNNSYSENRGLAYRYVPARYRHDALVDNYQLSSFHDDLI